MSDTHPIKLPVQQIEYDGKDIIIDADGDEPSLKQVCDALNSRDAQADAMKELLEAYDAMLANPLEIKVGNCLISNNCNPARLIALRQFDGDGNLLSYTHHNTVLEAYEALKERNK